ncbi:MAG: hypothetical protein QNK37_12010 [Acidobacteriota bacterium]|nr:hypothetical protein [Acidobacteriota bacterium]
MTLFLFFLFVNDLDFIGQDFLDEYELYRFNGGFVFQGDVYVNYLETLVRITPEKTVTIFNAKGEGPKELNRCNSFFAFNGSVWGYESTMRRIVKFNRDLEIETKIKIPDQSGYSMSITPGENVFYTFEYSVINHRDVPFTVKVRDKDTLEVIDTFTLPTWKPKNDKGVIRFFQIKDDVVGFTEFVQNDEHYEIFVLDKDSQVTSSLKHVTPQTIKSDKPVYRLGSYGATKVLGIIHLQDRVHVSMNALDTNAKTPLRKREWQFYEHVFDYKTKKPVSVNKSNRRLLPSIGVTEALIFYESDEGLYLKR